MNDALVSFVKKTFFPRKQFFCWGFSIATNISVFAKIRLSKLVKSLKCLYLYLGTNKTCQSQIKMVGSVV